MALIIIIIIILSLITALSPMIVEHVITGGREEKIEIRNPQIEPELLTKKTLNDYAKASKEARESLDELDHTYAEQWESKFLLAGGKIPEDLKVKPLALSNPAFTLENLNSLMTGVLIEEKPKKKVQKNGPSFKEEDYVWARNPDQAHFQLMPKSAVQPGASLKMSEFYDLEPMMQKRLEARDTAARKAAITDKHTTALGFENEELEDIWIHDYVASHKNKTNRERIKNHLAAPYNTMVVKAPDRAHVVKNINRESRTIVFTPGGQKLYK